MAQTKKKRRTKHRGNAAGMVETRGRTGRPPTAEERKAQRRATVRQPKPPSWQRAAYRSLAATVLFAVIVVLVMKQSVMNTIPLALFMLALYVPFGYYMDGFFYRRYQARQAKGQQ
ncbi:MAG: hypothetical protein QOG77_2485 [Solirubrobacteraceae bacterium]|jgi:hypothetical protein|nr:hypothetical protein [Solirubrobacteraceae bacterium]